MVNYILMILAIILLIEAEILLMVFIKYIHNEIKNERNEVDND